MGNGNKVEFLVAICALITSVMAVFMAWDQGRVMRAQQHGMVFPVLQVDGFAESKDDSVVVGITVTNSGVGPALIESVRLLIDGVETNGFIEYVESNPLEGYDLRWSAITGRALPPGTSVMPIEFEWPDEDFSRDALRQITVDSLSWNLEICYCSVFGKCWQTRELGRSRAKPIDACEPSDVDIFEQMGQYDLGLAQSNTPIEE